MNSRPNLLIQSNDFATKGQLRHFNFINKTALLVFININKQFQTCDLLSVCEEGMLWTQKPEMIICQGRWAAGVSTSVFCTHSGDNDVHKNWLGRLSLLLITTGPRWLKVQPVKEQLTDFPTESAILSLLFLMQVPAGLRLMDE